MDNANSRVAGILFAAKALVAQLDDSHDHKWARKRLHLNIPIVAQGLEIGLPAVAEDGRYGADVEQAIGELVVLAAWANRLVRQRKVKQNDSGN